MLTGEIIAAVLSILTGFGGYFAGRRQNLANTRTTELENTEKAVKFYREGLEDIANRWKLAVQDATEMNAKFQELNIKFQELNRKYTAAIDNLNVFESKLKKMAEVNKELIEELRKYKQLNGKSK